MDASPGEFSVANPDSNGAGLALEAGFGIGAGRYSLRRVLGHGKAGPVWVAWDEHRGEEVVLKFITGPLALNGFRLEELRREIAKARRLSHPNIVQVFDLYRLRDEPVFVSMEYVSGRSLEESRRDQPHGVLSWTTLQPLVREICLALEYAHGEGLVHGVLRPSSFIQDGRNRVRLVDFGLAILDLDSLIPESPPDHSDPRIAFMSPQQLGGAASLVSDDVYSLGASLYGLLSGTPPFRWNVSFQIRKVRPQAIGERILESGSPNEIPPLVAALLMACLAKDPEQRPHSAQAICNGMDAGGNESPSSPPRSGSAPAIGPAGSFHHDESSAASPVGPILQTDLGVSCEDIGGQPAENVGVSTLLRDKTLRWGTVATLIAGLLFWGWHWSGGRRVENDGAAVAPGQSVEEVQDVSAAAARPFVPDEAPEPQAVIVGGLPSDSVRPAKRLLSGHRDPVNSVAFAPDSTTLASGSFDATVRLWNGVTGDALGVLEGHQDRVESVAFSPDGATLASGGRDRTIRLWDARTGQAGMTLDGARSTVFMVAFSPDGATLAGGEENGEVTLWDCASGALRQRFQAHDGPVWSTAFSPDGLTLATGGVDRRVRFWNATNGAPRRAMIGHTEAVHSVAFSPDGTFLASSGRDRTIRIWRVSDGRLVRQWSTGATIGHALAYARRGNGLVSANEDGTLSLWNALTGTLVTNLMGHSGVVHSVAFAPDGRTLASGGHDQNVGLWDWEQWTEALPELSEFTELFNGHDLSGWRGNSRYWTVQDGVLTGSVPPGETLKTFLVWSGPPLGNFELRFVFRSEEGNSGVFFRAQEPKEDQVEGYQYEIWSDQTGGLIDVRNSGERRDLAPLGQRTVATDSRGIMLVHLVQTLAKPSMNRRTNPDGGWNEGVIVAEGNRIVQRLNGLTSSAVLDIDPTRGLSRGLLALELYGDGERRRAIQFKSIRLRRF